MPLSPKAKDRARLLLAAMGVAIVALAIMLVVFVYVPKQYLDHFSEKWTRFTVVTIAFAVYCLKTYWRARKSLHFWAILLCIFVIHFLGVGYLFYAGAGLPLALFGPTVALEWALLAVIVYHLLGIAPATR